MTADDIMWTIGGVAVFIGLMILAVCEYRDREYFHAWVRENCRLVRHDEGQTVLVSTGRGVGLGGTSDQSCYLCPSGVEECF